MAIVKRIASEEYVEERLGQIDNMVKTVNGVAPDKNGNVEISDAGVGISSITQTTTSTDDDGINVITVALTDGTSSTFIIQNGSKGDKGDSPVRGTDYWTDTDKVEIKNYINETIANIPRAEEVTF